ncbi:hypothetical protein JIN85_12160 [Luteolibacter pohnpeiensis]|uniref:DUF2017 domain-containing protein n=1 Tax=Luteolibacter pohnpeiensis TaxID=454153 RepID=A0A934VX46_9BACT|nr:hypothetical protein [Luteolibacter pohnpeiensis]MBK1883174.1 hypothetical protein [Luteolibacter pohnpeiensis]
MPTLEGGLRLEAESEVDWQILYAIPHDAAGTDLASRLGDLVTDDSLAEDWNDFVVPDLKSQFDNQIEHVSDAIREAHASAEGERGTISIKPAESSIWYGVLNQARLSLEEMHHFGNRDQVDLTGQDPNRRTAFFRSQFYCALQSEMLRHGLI